MSAGVAKNLRGEGIQIVARRTNTADVEDSVEERRVLLRQHFDRLYRFCEAAAPDHAEDLVQDTFVACLESRHRYRGDGSFVSFMLGIARNKILMHWRRKARRGLSMPVESVPLVDLAPSPSSVVRRSTDTARMVHELRRLPLDDQLVLQMHYWEGLTGPALSDALGIPEGTVRSRLRRAKARLAVRLKNDREWPAESEDSSRPFRPSPL